MKFVEVKEVPERTHKKDLRKILEDFMTTNIKVAKVDFNDGDYKEARYCANSIAVAVRRAALPITVTRRGEEVYLIRRDI